MLGYCVSASIFLQLQLLDLSCNRIEIIDAGMSMHVIGRGLPASQFDHQ